MLPRSIAVLPCHLGWRTLLKCHKIKHACLPITLMYSKLVTVTVTVTVVLVPQKRRKPLGRVTLSALF